MNRTVFGMGAYFNLSCTVLMKFGYLQDRATFPGTFPNSGLTEFPQSCCQQNSSTVETAGGMGVNATGTLGVAAWASTPLEHWGSQVERRRRDNRGAVGGDWGGVWGQAVPLPRKKIKNFSSQNGVIWCILGVLFLSFMCLMDCSCTINFILGKGVANTGRHLQVKYLGGRDPCGVIQYNTIQYKICKAPCCRGFRGAGRLWLTLDTSWLGAGS